MEISSLNNLYDVKFPLYMTSKVLTTDIVGIEVEDNIKYIQTHDEDVPFDVILYDHSTYLGRLLFLQKTEVEPIEYEFSFVDAAHFIYGRPASIPAGSIFVDDTGKIRKRGKIYGRTVNAKIKEKRDNYIWISNYYPPIRIPDSNMLHEVLDTFDTTVQLIEYKHTLYFKNITGFTVSDRRVRIL